MWLSRDFNLVVEYIFVFCDYLRSVKFVWTASISCNFVLNATSSAPSSNDRVTNLTDIGLIGTPFLCSS